LVDAQIRIAEGERITVAQQDIAVGGLRQRAGRSTIAGFQTCRTLELMPPSRTGR
jgi:biotin carboxylase